MRSMLVRLEHIMMMWALIILLLPFTCTFHICDIVGLQAASRTDLMLRRDGFTLDVQLVCMWLRRGVSFSSLVDMIFAMEGPLQGLKEQYSYRCCGFMFIGKKRFLCESPRSHVKHSKIN
jgi:hypothetical protein